MTSLFRMASCDRLLVFAATGILVLSACHDSPRENPLDPVLTPPVELTVALDDTAGTATLSWTPYSGDQPFAEYWVLRNVSRSTVVDTLARITVQSECAYRDTSLAPDTAYEYRVAVVNAGGFAADSAPQRVDGFTTRAVTLEPLVMERETGTVRLSWTRYRDPGFERCRILRQEAGTNPVEELAVFREVSDTTFSDTTARSGVEYAWTVVVEAAGRALTSQTREGQLALLPVRIVQAELDSRTATARVTWTRYRGPRFAGYQVLRRTASLVAQPVHQSLDLADTAFVDSTLDGNTEYLYQVVVATQADETVPSLERGGAFHQWLGEWSLPVAEGGQVRLYWEEGQLLALVVNRTEVLLQSYDPEGRLLEEQVLLQWPYGMDPMGISDALPLQNVSLARLPSGDRVLCLAHPGSEQVVLLAFSADGEPRWQETLLISGQPGPPSTPDAIHTGRWEVGGNTTMNMRFSTAGGSAKVGFTRIEVTVDDVPQLAGRQFVPKEAWDSWPPGVSTQDAGLAFSWAVSDFTKTRVIAVTKRLQSAWERYSLLADFSGLRGVANLAIGPGDNDYIDRHEVTVGYNQQLVWNTLRFDGIAQTTARDTLELVTPMIPFAPYRVRLEVDPDGWTAWFSHCLYWYGQAAAASTVDLARTEAGLVLLTGAEGRLLDLAGGVQSLASVPGPVSQTRSWTRHRSGRETAWMGLCLPEQHQVVIGTTTTSTGFGWPFNQPFLTTLGKGIGQDPDELVYPLSFARTANERFYVLDAGNARIEVFDEKGRYLTQWGRRGSGLGEFELGSGNKATDFSGSIVTDEEGNIYVADPGNQRIQKFAR